MSKPIDPIYTALGQVQRAQRKAAKKLVELTPERIEKSVQMFVTLESKTPEN